MVTYNHYNNYLIELFTDVAFDFNTIYTRNTKGEIYYLPHLLRDNIKFTMASTKDSETDEKDAAKFNFDTVHLYIVKYFVKLYTGVELRGDSF